MAESELFLETFEVMDPGEHLIVVRGMLPAQNTSEEVQLDLGGFIPTLNLFHWSIGDRTGAEKYPVRDNPLDVVDNSLVTVTLERGDGRFKFDPEEMQFRYGKRIAAILDQVIDMILIDSLGSGSYCFVGKPTED